MVALQVTVVIDCLSSNLVLKWEKLMLNKTYLGLRILSECRSLQAAQTI